MKRLYFHPKDDFTGSTRVINDIIEDSKDPISYIVTSGKGGFLSNNKKCKIYKVPLFHFRENCKLLNILNIPLGIINKFLLLFYGILIGRKFDEFYINTVLLFIPAWIGIIMKKTIIWHVHEGINGNWGSFAKFLSVLTFNNIKCKKIFVSKYTKEQYPNANQSDSIIKYNSLSNNFKKHITVKPIEIRSLTEVLLLCSFNESKGYKNFIKLAQQMEKYKFTLVLSAPFEQIKELCSSNLPENLTIFPAQKNVHPFYYNADLVMNLSIPQLWVETCGLTLIEAMSYGIPVIAPNVGGPTEFVKDDYNGFCVDTTDLNAIISKVTYILDRKNYVRLSYGALSTSRQF